MSRPDRRWLLTLASICGLILAYGVFLSKNATDNVGYLVGYNAVFGVIIFAVFRVCTGRKATRRLSGFAYLAILSSLVVASLIGYSRQKASIDRAEAHLAQGISSIVDASNDAQGNPKKIDTVLDPTKSEPGEIGERESFAKTYLNNEVALRNDYVAGLQAIGWPNILNADRIAKDTGLAQSFAMVDSATTLLQTFDEKMHALQMSARQEISSLPIGASTKAQMRAGFERGLSLSPLDTLLDLQAKSLVEYRAIFQLLRDTQGQWVVNKGKLVFRHGQDLAALQAHTTLIEKYLEQGQALEEKSTAGAQSTLEGTK
ncbi:MAG TPA: hypothetical protein VFX20_22670 [Steroidobacteraceae bacterium]|nr:hypothetical protein [Steroidobacteraceae bacterium]